MTPSKGSATPEAEAQLPSTAQLVRFGKRVERAMDHLENASYEMLEALRTFDGDKIPLRFHIASAWESAHSTEAAIPALKHLLSVVLTDLDAHRKNPAGRAPAKETP